MANNVLSRLTGLFEMLGADTDESGYDMAELKAYAAAVEMAYDYLDGIASACNVNTSSGLALSLYCELFGIDGSLTDDEKRNMIKQRFAESLKLPLHNELEHAFNQLNCIDEIISIGFFYSLTFDGNDAADVYALSRICRDLLPPCTIVSADGFNADFDFWDNTQLLFEDYDGLRLNFNMLDNLC